MDEGNDSAGRRKLPERLRGTWLESRDPGSIRLWRRLLSAPARFYKLYISPYMPPACRFEPTCAMYAIEAIEVHGLYGIWLAVVRLLKCQPFHPGGHDPVPPPRRKAGPKPQQTGSS
jgi:putative membrane protein insertion efficiency factor